MGFGLTTYQFIHLAFFTGSTRISKYAGLSSSSSRISLWNSSLIFFSNVLGLTFSLYPSIPLSSNSSETPGPSQSKAQ